MKAQKTRHLEFVLLTEVEHAKLVELLGAAETARWIEELNDYLGLSEKNRRKYDSHYHAIRCWARRQGSGSRVQGSGENYNRAADRFLQDLKEQATWPVMDPKVREIVYAVLRKRNQPWPVLRKALLDNPTIADQLRASFIEEARLSR